MSKPTSLPEWCSSGNYTEPAPGKKAVGWVPGERPGAQTMNWAARLVWQWLEFLDPLFTTNGGYTAPAGEHVTVSGAGEYKHGDQVLAISPLGGAVIAAGWVTNGGGYLQSSGGGSVYVAIPLKTGDRIRSVTFSRYGDGSADFSIVDVSKIAADGTLTVLATTTITNPPASWADTTIDVPDTTLAAGEALYMEFISTAANLRIGTIRATYDRP